MNYIKILFFFFLITFLFSGCGSDNNKSNSEVIIKESYTGYFEDSDNKYYSATIFMNENNAILTLNDQNDEDNIYQGTFNEDETILTFDKFSCTQSQENLICDDFKLITFEPTTTILLTDLDGTYNTVDSTNNIWTMNISNETINIYNDKNNCNLMGTVIVNGFPYYELEANDCSSGETFIGYSTSETLYKIDDSIDLKVPSFNQISNIWTK